MSNIVQVNNLSKTFQIKQKSAGFMPAIKTFFRPEYRTITAVDNISFSIKSGETVAFIGPNGAGKSTTIKMLTGILFPSNGQIEVLGLNPEKDRVKLAHRIGSVFGQRSQLWFHLPPIDTFNLLAKIYELNARDYENRLIFLVQTFKISDLLNFRVIF